MRIDLLKMGLAAKSAGAHLGGSLSLVEVMAALYGGAMRVDQLLATVNLLDLELGEGGGMCVAALAVQVLDEDLGLVRTRRVFDVDNRHRGILGMVVAHLHVHPCAVGVKQLVGARRLARPAGVAREHLDDLVHGTPLDQQADRLEVAVAAAVKRDALDDLARVVQVNVNRARAHAARLEVMVEHGAPLSVSCRQYTQPDIRAPPAARAVEGAHMESSCAEKSLRPY